MKNKSNPLKYFNDKADERRKALTKAQDGIVSENPPMVIPSYPSVISREVVKSPDGNYKTVRVHKEGPSGVVDKEKTRRTIKGIIKGVPKVDMRRQGPTPPPPSPMIPDMRSKMGGSVKSKKKK